MSQRRRNASERFDVGARVLVGFSRQPATVLQVDDAPSIMGEYAHTVRTENGDRRVLGSELELVPKPKTNVANESRGGLTQHFHAPVNQAIAMDRATQNVGQIGSSGNSLAEISDLLQQSYDLTRRQLEDALHAAKQLDIEAQKPEANRDWKSIAEWGNTLLGIAEKATDLTAKLAPHLPWVILLIEQARNHL